MSDTPKTDLLQGTLDLLVLRVLSPGPMHGFAISQRIQQVSRDILRVQQGSLYPALHRLERRKWVSAEWATSEFNRRAKYYRLTALGRRRLEEEVSSWERIASAVSLILEEA
jgi:transcriptional regulator